MKRGHQYTLPFIEGPKKGEETPQKLSLNRDKFIQYLTKSVEIKIDQAVCLFEEIETKLKEFRGKNSLEYLEGLVSSKLESLQVKKSPSSSHIPLTQNAEIVLRKRYLRKNDKGEVLES